MSRFQRFKKLNLPIVTQGVALGYYIPRRWRLLPFRAVGASTLRAVGACYPFALSALPHFAVGA
jgi:hypothetical protein